MTISSNICLNPINEVAQTNILRSLIHSGYYSEALEKVRSFEKQNPGQPEYPFLTAIIYLKQKAYPKAFGKFNEARLLYKRQSLHKKQSSLLKEVNMMRAALTVKVGALKSALPKVISEKTQDCTEIHKNKKYLKISWCELNDTDFISEAVDLYNNLYQYWYQAK